MKQCWIGIIMALTATFTVCAESRFLSGNAWKAEFNSETGALQRVTVGDREVIATSEELYEFDGTISGESGDYVIGIEETTDSISFRCRNRDLRSLELVKHYQMQGNTLARILTVADTEATDGYFQLRSATMFTPEFLKGAVYFQPMFDGFAMEKVAPFITPGDLKRPQQLCVTSLGVILNTSVDIGLRQWKQAVNGEYVWPSSILPGEVNSSGWVLGITVGYPGRKPLQVETRLEIFPPDIRAFYDRFEGFPDPPEYRMPEWYDHVKFFSHHPSVSEIYQAPWGVAAYRNQERYLAPGERQILYPFVWSLDGDYRTDGELSTRFGPPDRIAPEEFANRIHALASKQTVVGLYANTGCIAVDAPAVKDHPEWFTRDAAGNFIARNSNTVNYETDPENEAYRQYVLRQYAGMLDFYGAEYLYTDWLYITEVVDFRRQNVSYHGWKLMRDLARLAAERGTVFLTNAAGCNNYAAGGFLEFYPDWQELDRHDWRAMSDCFLFSKLTYNRPDRWVSALYWPRGNEAYANRILLYGVKPSWFWVKPALRYILHQAPMTELAWEMRHCTIPDSAAWTLTPDWRKLETQTLETNLLTVPSGDLLIGAINHAKTSEAVRLTLDGTALATPKTYYLWQWTPQMNMVKLTEPAPRTVAALLPTHFQPLQADGVLELPEMKLKPEQLQFTVMHELPVFVYAEDGKRRNLLLNGSETTNLKNFSPGADGGYTLECVNGKTVELLLYLGDSPKTLEVNAQSADWEPMTFRRDNFALLKLEPGTHQLRVAPRKLTEQEAGDKEFHGFAGAAAETKTLRRFAAQTYDAALLEAASWVPFTSGVASSPLPDGNGWRFECPDGESVMQNGFITPVQTVGMIFKIRGDVPGSVKITMDEQHTADVEYGPEWHTVRIPVTDQGPFEATQLKWVRYGKAGSFEFADLRFLPASTVAKQPRQQVRLALDGTPAELELPGPENTRVTLAVRQNALVVTWSCIQKQLGTYPTPKERDAPVWNGDDVELFLQIGDGNLLQLACDPAGTRYDAERIDGRTDLSWNPEWECRTVQSDEGWNATMTVPFAALGVEAPQPGTVWRFNLGRQTATGGEHNGAFSWSPGGFTDLNGELVYE